MPLAAGAGSDRLPSYGSSVTMLPGDAMVVAKSPGLLPMNHQGGLLLPFAHQPINGLPPELSVRPHAPLHKVSVDVRINAVQTAARILSQITHSASYLFIRVIGQGFNTVGTPVQLFFLP